MSGGEVNKRAVENFIKAGALDGLEGTRKQKMFSYIGMMEGIIQEKKNSLEGQMSLFDFVSREEQKSFETAMPDVGEYDKETLLGFEKEVLGIYISGHPLEEYEDRWRKNITATTADFLLDEDTGETKVKDKEIVTIGGMITDKTIKYTRNNQAMAFLTIEDLLGTVEVVVFPRNYEKDQAMMQEEAKVFIRGRANVEEEKNGKIICEKIYSFDDAKKELWVQFTDKKEFESNEAKLYETLLDSDGEDKVVIYLAEDKAMKRLPASRNVRIDKNLICRLSEHFGEKNIKVVEKAIEKKR
jgi:DNA polymerase-3 subunit alpha